MDQIMNYLNTTLLEAGMPKKKVDKWIEERKADHRFCEYMLFDDDINRQETSVVEEKEKSEEKPSPKEKSVKTPKVQKKTSNSDITPLKYLKENPDEAIEYSGEKKGKHSEQFEKYKHAKTYNEYLELGGVNGHINYDFNRGLLKIPGFGRKSEKNIASKSSKPVSGEKVIKKEKKPKKIKKEKDIITTPPKSNESSENPVPKKVKKEKAVITSPPKSNEIQEEKKTTIKTGKVMEHVKNIEAKMIQEYGELDSQSIESDDDSDEWPHVIVDGVEYIYNISDRLLVDPNDGKQIGYLNENDKIEEYVGDGEQHHELNKEKL